MHGTVGQNVTGKTSPDRELPIIAVKYNAEDTVLGAVQRQHGVLGGEYTFI